MMIKDYMSQEKKEEDNLSALKIEFMHRYSVTKTT